MTKAKMGRPKKTVGTPIICPKCGYEGRTEAEAKYIHCTQCSRIMKNPRYHPLEAK